MQERDSSAIIDTTPDAILSQEIGALPMVNDGET